MSQQKKLIAVVGATGEQGGSVLNHLLSSGRYRVRALTRNPLKLQSIALKTKWGADLELVKCDVSSANEVLSAFTGCWGAFCVTDFWSNPDVMIEKEFDYGKNLLDSAVQANVTHVVWSCRPDVTAFSQGKIPLPHCDNKFRVEEYARTQFKGRSDVKTTFSFVYAGVYMQNFLFRLPGLGLALNTDGFLYNYPIPLQPTVRLPLLNITEFGGFVLPMFDNYVQFNNRRVFAYNEYITIPQFFKLIAQTLNTKAIYIACSYDDFLQITGSNEFVQTFKFFNEYEYYCGLDRGESPAQIYPNLMSVEDAVKHIDWASKIKTGLLQRITTRVGTYADVIIETIGAIKDTVVESAEKLREGMTSSQEETFKQAE